MTKHTQLGKILEVLSRALRNPLLKDVTLEAAVQYCIDFISIYNFPEMYLDKEVEVEIHNYRGELPCDLVSINQVKEVCSGICLRSMTDTFLPEKRHCNNYNSGNPTSLTFKVLNHVIFTSFEEGNIKVSYKAVAIDEDGFPLIPDDPLYHKALELYIKVQAFTILFDLGKLRGDVLTHTEQQYAWAAGLLTSAYNTPDEAEMASIIGMWTEMIQTNTHRDNGYRNLGDREHITIH